MVRPAGLTDGNATEGEFKVAEGEYAVSKIIIMIKCKCKMYIM